MRGPRVTQLLSLTAAIAAATAVWLALPAQAEEECGPYTRTQLEADRNPTTTTTTAVIDAVGPVPGRGVEVDPGAVEDLLPPAPDSEEPEPPPDCPEFVYEMEYPLLGAGTFGSGFGAPRDGGARLHMGVDLAAAKLTPVVAVADSTVAFVRDAEAQCCYVGLTHDDGWESWYIHLNNDSFDTDDGGGIGIRPGLRAGDRVAAGELIGWVGDSGNAETTVPHLHFELHLPSGEPVDAWPSVREARESAARAVLDASGTPQEAEGEGELDPLAASADPEMARPEFVGPFLDDEGTAAEPMFAELTATGVDLWCDAWGIRVCPGDPAMGADAEAWVAAITGTTRDPSVSIAYGAPAIDPDLDRSLACSIAQYCPGQPVTFGEVAAMIIGSSDGTSVLGPADAAAQLTPKLGTCPVPAPDQDLTRAELAELLVRWRSPAEGPCPDPA